MPPRLYSSGGETQASAANVQATPVPGVDGLIQTLNSFASEQLQKSVAETKGRITDLASKAQQDMQLKGGDNYLLAETPRFASAEFYNTYERASRKVLLEEMKNDVRDLALQAMNTETTFSDPKAFEAAYKQQYTMMRDKVMVNAEFARDFVPELDEVFRENLTNFKYEVSARQMNWMRQNVDIRTVDAFNRRAETLRNEIMQSGFEIKDVDDYQKRFYSIFNGGYKEAAALLNSGFMSPDEKFLHTDPLEDSIAFDYMQSALTALYMEGKYELANEIIAKNAKGELFRDNPTLRAKMQRAGAGAADVMRYFAENVEKQVKAGMNLSDLRTRILEANDSSDLAKGIARSLPENATNYDAIRSVYNTLYVTDKGPQSAWKDREATVYLGDLLNGYVSTGGVSARGIIQKFFNHDPSTATAPTISVQTITYGELGVADKIQVSLGGVALGEFTPEYDKNNKLVVDTPLEALYRLYEEPEGKKSFSAASFNTNVLQPVLKDLEQQMKYMYDTAKAGKSVATAYFKGNPAARRDLVELTGLDNPSIPAADGGVKLAQYLAPAHASARAYGQTQAAIAANPLDDDTAKFATNLIDTYTSPNSMNPELALRTIRVLDEAGNRVPGSTGTNALRQLGGQMQYVSQVASVLPSDKAKDLLSKANMKNVKQSFNEQQLGVISGGLGRMLVHKELGPKIAALSNGSAVEREAVWNQVLWPYITATSLVYSESGEVDIGKSIQSAIANDGALYQLLKDVPEPVSVNPENKSLGTTVDPRWRLPEVRTALSKITKMYGGRSDVPVITTNESGVKVMRLAQAWGSSVHRKDQLGNYVEVEIK